MLNRLTTAVIVLVFGISAFAGANVYSGSSDCAMSSMEGMDCCALAASQSLAPEVASAKLCCMIECPGPGTAPQNAGSSSISRLLIVQLQPVILRIVADLH